MANRCLTLVGGRFARKKIRFIEKIRPTSTKVRKAVFTVLGEFFSGGTFLDLFAGSGAMAIESISRGMERAILVEKDPEVVEVIEKNLSLVKEPYIIAPKNIPEKGVVILPWGIKRAIKFLAQQGIKADVVYIDPPYYGRWERTVLRILDEYPILKPTSRVFLEHYKRIRIDESKTLILVKRREYGDTNVSEYRVKEEDFKNTFPSK